jgi:hypothetical protein
MLRRRRVPDVVATSEGPAVADFHEWVLSLPWTVERPSSIGTPSVRCFGVDCEPLGRRQLWLLTGMRCDVDPTGLGLAVIVPRAAAKEVAKRGWGRTVAPMPAGHSLVTVNADRVPLREDVEALVLTAYSYAMS